jgi:cytochrome P450 PksS
MLACRPDTLGDARFPLYQRLREEAPVFRLGSRVLISRFADVRAILIDDDRFVNYMTPKTRPVEERFERLDSDEDRAKLKEYYAFKSAQLTKVDGEMHRRLRNVVERVFTPRVVQNMSDRVQEVTTELLDPRASSGRMDIVTDFAWKLPLTVMSELLGVPLRDGELIHQWSAEVALMDTDDWQQHLELSHESMFKLRTLVLEHFDAMRGAEATSLMGKLLAARDDAGEGLNETELVGMTYQLLRAGHLTTTEALGCAVLELLRNRDQWNLLCSDPSLAGRAVEETLRCMSPFQILFRRCAVGSEIGGVQIEENDGVLLLIGSANRDVEQFPDPDRFDIMRGDLRHAAFGFGPHYCLGASLNRLEVATALSTLARRFPEMRLEAHELAWTPNVSHFGVLSLPVSLGPDHG